MNSDQSYRCHISPEKFGWRANWWKILWKRALKIHWIKVVFNRSFIILQLILSQLSYSPLHRVISTRTTQSLLPATFFLNRLFSRENGKLHWLKFLFHQRFTMWHRDKFLSTFWVLSQKIIQGRRYWKSFTNKANRFSLNKTLIVNETHTHVKTSNSVRNTQLKNGFFN